MLAETTNNTVIAGHGDEAMAISYLAELAGESTFTELPARDPLR